MLETLRQNTKSWIAQLFIALLILSFAVWGISDSFTGGGEQALATVGEQQITSEQFRDAYQTQITSLSARFGRQITSEEARQFRVPESVLDQLINAAAIDTHADRLGLGITDEVVARSVVENPAFQGLTGRFDRTAFQQILRANNLTEETFIAQERADLIRSQIADTLTQTALVPDTLIEAANLHQNETRVLSYFTVAAPAASDIEAPGEAELRAFHEANPDRFITSEYRRVGLIRVSPPDLAGQADISPEQVRADYDNRIQQYRTPEKRVIEQIIFPDVVSASAAHDRLREGADFMAVAAEQGMSEADVRLGEMTRDDLADPAIAEAAFALDEGTFSPPVEGTFATVIVRASDFTPATERTFEDVREEIARELAERAVAERVLGLHDRIEDERAAGSLLPEIAETFELNYATVTLDRSGLAPEGEPVDAELITPAVRGAIFEAEEGAELDPIDLGGTGYIWYDLLEVMPPQTKAFDQVRDEVEAAWRDAELRKQVRAAADALAEKARNGTPMSELAAEAGASLVTTEPLKRNATQAPGSSAIGQAFVLPKDGIGTVSGEGAARIVFKVDQINVPDALPQDEVEALRTSLARQLDTDIATQYLSGLRQQFDLSISPDWQTRMFGQ